MLCTYDDDLRALVTKMNSNKAHRAFVMDNKQPVAVVSPSDIFRVLSKAEWKPLPSRPRGPSAEAVAVRLSLLFSFVTLSLI